MRAKARPSSGDETPSLSNGAPSSSSKSKKRPLRDENAPKIPMNPYTYFMNEHKEEFKNQPNARDIISKLAAKWRSLTEGEKSQNLAMSLAYKLMIVALLMCWMSNLQHSSAADTTNKAGNLSLNLSPDGSANISLLIPTKNEFSFIAIRPLDDCLSRKESENWYSSGLSVVNNYASCIKKLHSGSISRTGVMIARWAFSGTYTTFSLSNVSSSTIFPFSRKTIFLGSEWNFFVIKDKDKKFISVDSTQSTVQLVLKSGTAQFVKGDNAKSETFQYCQMKFIKVEDDQFLVNFSMLAEDLHCEITVKFPKEYSLYEPPTTVAPKVLPTEVKSAGLSVLHWSLIGGAILVVNRKSIVGSVDMVKKQAIASDDRPVKKAVTDQPVTAKAQSEEPKKSVAKVKEQKLMPIPLKKAEGDAKQKSSDGVMETQDSSFEVVTDSSPPLESKVKKQLESRAYLKKEERGEPLNSEDLFYKEIDAANARPRVRSYHAKKAKGPKKPNEEQPTDELKKMQTPISAQREFIREREAIYQRRLEREAKETAESTNTSP